MYSIIIPTAFDHLEEDLKPCIESIIEYTDLSQVEVIIVSNGCTDNTDEYVRSLGEPFRLLTYPKALGYAKAVNAGLYEAKGDYIVLLNNDVVLLKQNKNQWLNYLVDPCLSDPSVGITGPMIGFHKEAGQSFVIFFCALLKKELVDKLKLNEEYDVGTCEDVEFCIEAQKLGYKMVQVTPQNIKRLDARNIAGEFPIWHKGSSTMASLPPEITDGVWTRNSLMIAKKYNSPWYQEYVKNKANTVLAFVPTKDRYECLTLCLQSIAMQTRPPNKLIIYDDGEHKDLREVPLYKHIFKLMDSKKIEWKVIFGSGKGQHHGHEIANTENCDFVWRIDDDEIAEATVLEKLLSHMAPDVGAVGGAVFTPGEKSFLGSNKITDVFHAPNIQWSPDSGICDVEHLYSSFLYRANVAHYNLNLSPVAHREETMFTHDLKTKGYRLIVDTSIKTYHYRYPTGGIRSNTSQFMFEHDNRLFLEYLKNKGILVLTLDNGLGDHLAFSNLIPDLFKKYNHLILGCCYPDVFKDYKHITTIPVAHTKTFTEDNIYKFCIDNKWKRSIIDAYREMLNI